MQHLVRLPDWRSRLMVYVAGTARTAFRPGAMDCALFAAGAVAAQTGVDFAADWRGKYRTLEEGLAALAETEAGDHVGLAARLLPEIAPAFAGVGDVAATLVGNELMLGVVQGPFVWVRQPASLGVVPLTAAARAFRV